MVTPHPNKFYSKNNTRHLRSNNFSNSNNNHYSSNNKKNNKFNAMLSWYILQFENKGLNLRKISDLISE